MHIYKRKDGTEVAYERKDGKQLLTARLNPEIVIEMKVYAARHKMSVAAFIEMIAREFLIKEGAIASPAETVSKAESNAETTETASESAKPKGTRKKRTPKATAETVEAVEGVDYKVIDEIKAPLAY